MGDLVPIMCMEVLPGDSFRVNSEIFARLQALASPVMHRVNLWTHFFFVPNRLIWDEWEDFITGGRTGAALPAWPHFSLDGTSNSRIQAGSLADYLGIPSNNYTGAANLFASLLPFRAYQLIYDEYYRDDTLTQPTDFPRTSGLVPDLPSLDRQVTLRKRAWEKDYFTSARPNTQLGTEVNVPISNTINYRNRSRISTDTGANPAANTLIGVDAAVIGDNMVVNKPSNVGTGAAGRIENLSSILSQLTINNLRRSLRLQEWLEKNMRGGARYVEQIMSHFGVRSSDARLQRPEYLGGGKQQVNISEVLATAADPNQGIGYMGGHAYSVGNSNRFEKRFEEHGFVIGITSMLPRTSYQQGIARMFNRRDKFDYYWPEFANIGEQEVLNREVFLDPANVPGGNLPFGYQERYAEYKYEPCTVHGDFRNSLAFWHMGRVFASLPNLNTQFVEADPTQRIFAVTDPNVDKVLMQVYNHVSAVRPMPYMGIPTI